MDAVSWLSGSGSVADCGAGGAGGCWADAAGNASMADNAPANAAARATAWARRAVATGTSRALLLSATLALPPGMFTTAPLKSHPLVDGRLKVLVLATEERADGAPTPFSICTRPSRLVTEKRTHA